MAEIEVQMIPFQTTIEQVNKIPDISSVMINAGLDPDFVAGVSEMAKTCQGAYELMELWFDPECDPEERKNIVSDLLSELEYQKKWVK